MSYPLPCAPGPLQSWLLSREVGPKESKVKIEVRAVVEEEGGEEGEQTDQEEHTEEEEPFADDDEAEENYPPTKIGTSGSKR